MWVFCLFSHRSFFSALQPDFTPHLSSICLISPALFLPLSAFTPHLHSISFISLPSSQCSCCFAIRYPSPVRLRLTPSAPHPLVSSVHIQVRSFHQLLPSDKLSFSHPAAVVVSCSCYCVFLRLAVFACSILIYFTRSSSWHNYQQHRTCCMGIYISVKKWSTIEKQKIRKKPFWR